MVDFQQFVLFHWFLWGFARLGFTHIFYGCLSSLHQKRCPLQGGERTHLTSTSELQVRCSKVGLGGWIDQDQIWKQSTVLNLGSEDVPGRWLLTSWMNTSVVLWITNKPRGSRCLPVSLFVKVFLGVFCTIILLGGYDAQVGAYRTRSSAKCSPSISGKIGAHRRTHCGHGMPTPKWICWFVKQLYFSILAQKRSMRPATSLTLPR